MIPVEEALRLIVSNAAPAPAETVPVGEGMGRVLAADIIARIDQPPFRASAMDGYAVRFEDAGEGARLRVVGEAAAGAPLRRPIGKGEAARIFTGGVVPAGADHVVIQEETRAEGGDILITAAQKSRANIREAGIDFRARDTLKKAGERLSAIDLALIASANVATIEVRRKPAVAYFDNGDELVEPGETLSPGRIVGSNRFAMEAMIASWGGAPRYLGRAGDARAAIREKFETAREADIVVTVGGASVGDHDHMRAAFADAGGDIIFSKIAVRPGKPTWFGALGRARALGLPGNPASAIVCAALFLKPLIEASAGERARAPFMRAALVSPLKANGPRESYLRARIGADGSGRLAVTAFAEQDSSLVTPLANGNCLIRRPVSAPAAEAGDIVDCLVFDAIIRGAP